MKTFLVLSDTHGRRSALLKISALVGENDYIIHLGDGAGDMRSIRAEFPEKTVVLKGNCDFSYGDEERILEVEGIKLLCCHGHRYGVKSGLKRLAARAKQAGCAVALYGHTHRANIEELDGVMCINPGAMGDFVDPSYCYLVLHAGKATPTIVSMV